MHGQWRWGGSADNWNLRPMHVNGPQAWDPEEGIGCGVRAQALHRVVC